MAKYIFCDIDGPLLPGKMHLYPKNAKIKPGKLATAEPLFDNFAVQCFNIWAKYADAKIIFSTNWSINGASVEQLKAIMFANRLDFTNRYHDDILTPKKFTSQRGSEIWWWIMDNAKDGDKFIAVDDDTSCNCLKDYMRPRDMDKHYPEGVKDYMRPRDMDKHYLEGVTKPKITGQWIEVNFKNGLSWQNFIDGCTALDIDLEDISEQEFGIKKLTAEEKAKREEALDLMSKCFF